MRHILSDTSCTNSHTLCILWCYIGCEIYWYVGCEDVRYIGYTIFIYRVNHDLHYIFILHG